MASKKNDFEEETDDNYAYYAFRKVPKSILSIYVILKFDRNCGWSTSSDASRIN